MKYTPCLKVILKELNLSIPSFRMIYWPGSVELGVLIRVYWPENLAPIQICPFWNSGCVNQSVFTRIKPWPRNLWVLGPQETNLSNNQFISQTYHYVLIEDRFRCVDDLTRLGTIHKHNVVLCISKKISHMEEHCISQSVRIIPPIPKRPKKKN